MVSAKALDDLEEIWVYIAEDSPNNADNFLDQLQAKFSSLADNPNIGVSRGQLAEGLRAFPIGNYLIYYRATDSELQIIRVTHGARDQAALFDMGEK